MKQQKKFYFAPNIEEVKCQTNSVLDQSGHEGFEYEDL